MSLLSVVVVGLGGQGHWPLTSAVRVRVIIGLLPSSDRHRGQGESPSCVAAVVGSGVIGRRCWSSGRELVLSWCQLGGVRTVP